MVFVLYVYETWAFNVKEKCGLRCFAAECQTGNVCLKGENINHVQENYVTENFVFCRYLFPKYV